MESHQLVQSMSAAPIKVPARTTSPPNAPSRASNCTRPAEAPEDVEGEAPDAAVEVFAAELETASH
jgi:hypothetical protein